jgi:hypothetical protein
MSSFTGPLGVLVPLSPGVKKEGEAPLALTRYPQLAHLRPRK